MKTFRNIIATLHDDSEKYIVLAAHYDSKLFEDFKFVAATDSAASCAILIELARSLKESFSATGKWGLKIVFFDGEEAFKTWNAKDSIYGARHLAEKWEKEVVDGRSVLDKIDVFVLLDLLGHKESFVTSRFQETDAFFGLLASTESLLKNRKMVPGAERDIFVHKKQFNFRVEDDHIPFLRRNVPIVHLIPVPFPPFWHSAGDTVDKVDLDTLITIQSVLEYTILAYTNH